MKRRVTDFMHYENGLLSGRLFVLLLLGTILAPSPVAAENSRRIESRALVQEYSKRLTASLQNAMAKGGPVAAISVCKDIAPRLASELSRRSGAKITRVSRRYRNPMSAPEDWQERVLQEFDEGSPQPGEAQEFYSTNSGADRYMSSIRIKPLCALCHGRALTRDVHDQLALEYPHDRAQGYEIGQLRGAFSVAWPAAGSTQ